MNMSDEKFMRNHWNSEAERYISTRKWSRTDQRILNFITEIKPQNLLEIGFGPCVLAEKIREVKPEISYFGLDLSENFIEEAKKVLGDWGKLILASASTPPFRMHSFDCILEMTAIHHFPKAKIPYVVDEVALLLKPGGKLICVEDWAAEPENEREHMAKKLRRTAGLTRNDDEYHPSDGEWTEMFRNAGLRVLKLEHDTRPLDIFKISDERNPDNERDLEYLKSLWEGEQPTSRMSIFYVGKE